KKQTADDAASSSERERDRRLAEVKDEIVRRSTDIKIKSHPDARDQLHDFTLNTGLKATKIHVNGLQCAIQAQL
ncbi:hypothetical protein ACCT19_30635, partial [Rhizobium ruizarguesonis]